MTSSAFEDVIARLKHIVSSSAPRETRARQIADTIRQFGNHRWVGVYDVSSTEIAIIAWSGPAAPTYPRFPVGRGLSGAAVKTGQVVIANDVRKDSRYLPTLETTGAEIIVPVLSDAVVVGTIDVESDAVGRFTAADRKLLERCGDAVRPLWR